MRAPQCFNGEQSVEQWVYLGHSLIPSGMWMVRHRLRLAAMNYMMSIENPVDERRNQDFEFLQSVGFSRGLDKPANSTFTQSSVSWRPIRRVLQRTSAFSTICVPEPSTAARGQHIVPWATVSCRAGV